jgi:hypothetical protein
VQRDQVNAHAAVHGIKPEALWASGVELHELLDANGVPDEKAITAAVAAARTTLGIESPRKPVRSLKSGAAIPQERRDSWSSAFAPRER